jgi:hypothetical protein
LAFIASQRHQPSLRLRRDGSPCHRDHRKLVTPEARRDIDLAARGLNPTGDILEELVAGLMPERTVHALESVEVEEQDREFRAKTPMPRQRCVEPVLE